MRPLTYPTVVRNRIVEMTREQQLATFGVENVVGALERYARAMKEAREVVEGLTDAIHLHRLVLRQEVSAPEPELLGNIYEEVRGRWGSGSKYVCRGCREVFRSAHSARFHQCGKGA